MAKTIEHVHWPDAPDMWMPYAPAIKVKGGTTVYLAGVTAAPVYHHHPHRPEEFDAMPRDMEGQARAALENLRRGLEAVGHPSPTWSLPTASSPTCRIKTRSIGSGGNTSAMPSPRQRPCRWCGLRPIPVAWSKSTRWR
jgi:enamine deaminase RidA (YjgF/YER057c/UK114 family)